MTADPCLMLDYPGPTDEAWFAERSRRRADHRAPKCRAAGGDRNCSAVADALADASAVPGAFADTADDAATDADPDASAGPGFAAADTIPDAAPVVPGKGTRRGAPEI